MSRCQALPAVGEGLSPSFPTPVNNIIPNVTLVPNRSKACCITFPLLFFGPRSLEGLLKIPNISPRRLPLAAY